MFKLFDSPSFEPEIDAKTLQTLLDEIVTPRLLKKGFAKRGNYGWRNDNNKFRQRIGYTRLKGAAGTFTWGVNIDFIPLVRSDRIEYYKTDKRFLLHLWEGTDEYRSSFSGGDIKKGIASHWGFKNARETISDLFDRYEEKIFEWFAKADSLEQLIETAQQQAAHDNFYNIHSPRPTFVLAFLYAKAKKVDKAMKAFETLEMYQFDNSEELKDKVKAKLLMLTTETSGT
jgi:hypothetical protein